MSASSAAVPMTDTGAVWGGKLTALQLDTDEVRVVQVAGRDVPLQGELVEQRRLIDLTLAHHRRISCAQEK